MAETTRAVRSTEGASDPFVGHWKQMATCVRSEDTTQSVLVPVHVLYLEIVQVKVTLRLTVSQSVYLGVEPKYGTFDQRIFFFQSYCLVFLGRPL
jgi:hypothetical protein